MTKKRSIFLTGVTGALGTEIIKRLLETTNDKLFLLIRRRQRLSHWDRARKMLKDWGFDSALGTRVHVLEGDVTEPQLGLQDYEIDHLQNEVTHFYHIAALTALNGSEEDCYRVNLEGTRHALDVAWCFRNQGKLERFFYFSTAYVAGSLQDYISKEDELPKEPAFANYYESSKYNAEKNIRAAMMEGLPATIFRPSIVVGDSKTGQVSEFNVIYPFMKLFACGMLSQLPAHPEHAFNIVPIDFVVEASLALSQMDDTLGKTYHLVSDKPPQIGMLIEMKDKEFPQFPEIELVNPDEFSKENLDPMQKSIYAMLEPYLGYLTGELRFDTANTRKALAKTKISLPETDYQFMRIISQFAVDQGYLIAP